MLGTAVVVGLAFGFGSGWGTGPANGTLTGIGALVGALVAQWLLVAWRAFRPARAVRQAGGG